MASGHTMNIDLVPINALIPYARNPRINAQAVDKVAASIKEFGFRQPIVADTENVIIAGHTRLLAAQKLKLEQVPVHIADNLTDAQKRAYRIADNRVSEDAEWDLDLLKIELSDLPDFDLDILGFNDDELSLYSGNVDGSDYPEMYDGDKEPFQQKTFTLHDEQAQIVEDAIQKAKFNPAYDTGLNENSNGNALAFICEAFL